MGPSTAERDETTMTTNKKFFSGNSIEQAVLQAARHFEIEASEVAYRQVERRHGFLKTRRRAVIEVDVDNPRRKQDPEPVSTAVLSPSAVSAVEEPVAEESQVPREPSGGDEPPESVMTALPETPERRLERAESEQEEAAREAIRRLCNLGELTIEAEVFKGEDGLEIELSGADEGIFLEDRGRLLLAMQHLMPRLIRGLVGETIPCRVDCDNFQEIRAEQLRVLAQKVAAEVRDRGRSRMLEPMSPDERRIVHMTLADDRAVETESQGTGLFKRVKVMPTNRRSRSLEPYRR